MDHGLKRLAAAAAFAVFSAGPAVVLAEDGNGVAQVTVMTRNLYLGGDIATVLQSGSVQQFIDAATTVFGSVRATDFHERAQEIAGEIAATQPDLVGLQEVVLWRSSALSRDDTIEYDFLAILLSALEARHLSYEAIAVVEESQGQALISETGLHCQIADFVPAHCRDVRFLDRDVVLVKRGSGASNVTVNNAQVQHFGAQFSVPLPNGQTFTTNRGWASVDAQVRGHTFRFVTAHLEPDVIPVQVAQAAEILAGPLDASTPVVFVCDCNSPADESGSATYGDLVAAGLRDAWTEKPPVSLGYTCCQDGDLLNVESALDERIDLVWLRGAVRGVELRTVGAAQHDRTPSGLWPSDHAGVVGKLLLD